MTLTDDDIKYLEGRFVTIKECDEKNDRTQADIAQMRVDMRELNTKLAVLIKIVATIGSAALVPLVAMAIKVIFGGNP
jgi:hypothetical protein